MKVKEYFQLAKIPGFTNVTFIKARARKDAHTPSFHAEYQTTPVYTLNELKDNKIMDYIILNDKQSPIDWLSGAPWNTKFKQGNLLSMLVISNEDLKVLYSENQAQSMERYIDDKLKESLGM